jgi:hypothetical protein
MRRCSRFLIFISSLVITAPVYRKDPLSGAFGIEFGERLSDLARDLDIGMSNMDGSFKSHH